MADTNVALQSALIAWWECHRPLGWVEEDHVAKPLVNCQTDEEQALALIAADIARSALASRPAEVDDEGLPALPQPMRKVYERPHGLQELLYYTAEQFRQGQRDAVAADRARREKLPANADEMVAFIGSHYNSMRDDKPDPNDIVYELTVHDLLSAFRWWFDDYELEDEPSHTTNKEK